MINLEVSMLPDIKNIDWILISAVLATVFLGLVTMYSFSGESQFFERQLVWLAVGLVVFFGLSLVDMRFLRRSGVVMLIFLSVCVLLVVLLATGATIQGAQRWLEVGGMTFQVSEFAKLALVILLAKYFTRRHVEIAHFRHIVISGAYTGILFLLIFFQPDLGTAMILAFIWFGMILVSGIPKKQLFIVLAGGLLIFGGMWAFALEDHQRDRVATFFQPYTDLEGSDYHIQQSTIAVGSGQLWGKGIGRGTQSRLEFLPEHETDFIFAAFAEEWGFVGVIVLFVLQGIIIWRILQIAWLGATNFETFFAIGVAILFMSHLFIHVGANVGMLPVTGTTLPFMSFGGSHLLVSFVALGILMSMRGYKKVLRKEDMMRESHLDVSSPDL